MLSVHTTTTSSLLLEGLRDSGNDAVWVEFDRRYRPILLGIARRLGLSDDDAADVAQETMTRFLQEYRAGRYDRSRGRLRSWIISIVRFRVADLRRAQAERGHARGDSAFVDLPDDSHLDAIWDAERGQALLRQAIAELREQTKLNERTIQAFELYAVLHRPASEVAGALGLTVHDVYMAKSNVAEKLREILARMEELFDDG